MFDLMENIVEKVSKLNSTFKISPSYVTGKLDVEYMSQDALPLMSAKFNGVRIELSVNGQCMFEYEDEVYQYEKHLSPELIRLMREGSIDFEASCWYEFFDDDSYNVGEWDMLPQVGRMKKLFIDDFLCRATKAGVQGDVDFLSGFDFIGYEKDTNSAFTKDFFEKTIQDILSYQDIFDVVPFFEPEFIQDDYGKTHFGVFLYTQTPEAKEYIRNTVEGLI